MEKKHSVKKGNYKGQFIYRDVKFDKSDRIPNSYWGAYFIGNKCFAYRQEVIEYIDQSKGT